MPAKSHRMPACGPRDIEPLLEVVHSFRGSTRVEVDRFVKALTPKGLCIVLHSMRRWYSAQSFASARKLLERQGILGTAMDLGVPWGVYRGFRIRRGDPNWDFYYNLKPGDKIELPVRLNGGCSSWTLRRAASEKFSGANSRQFGVLVRLSGGSVRPFIAPRSRSKKWFNLLYERTMGSSFRSTEDEYALHSSRLKVEIVRIKRR